MTDPAIRTVREDDDTHVIEGMIAFGGPFNGRDSYRTFASPRTNFYWDMFPDTIPTESGTRSGEEPRYIRPVNYQHGFDPELGMDAARVGGISPVRTFDQGVWVQAQLDKHNKYYGAIRELLGAEALAFSAESMEHAVRIDERTGEWLEWPMVAVALTPTPSNPWSFVASRSAGDIERVLRVVAEHAPAGDPEAEPDAPAVRLGARNAARDQAHIDAIHQHITALGASAHADAEPEPDPADTDKAEEADEAARSGDAVPAVIRIVEPADPAAERRRLADLAQRAAEAALRSYRGDAG